MHNRNNSKELFRPRSNTNSSANSKKSTPVQSRYNSPSVSPKLQPLSPSKQRGSFPVPSLVLGSDSPSSSPSSSRPATPKINNFFTRSPVTSPRPESKLESKHSPLVSSGMLSLKLLAPLKYREAASSDVFKLLCETERLLMSTLDHKKKCQKELEAVYKMRLKLYDLISETEPEDEDKEQHQTELTAAFGEIEETDNRLKFLSNEIKDIERELVEVRDQLTEKQLTVQPNCQ